MKNGGEHRDGSAPQQSQDDEYWFPYHFVTRFSPEDFRQHFADSWGVNYATSIEFVMDRVAAIAPNSLVDVGCGDGRISREAHCLARVPCVVGVDYSLRAINLARAMNQDVPALEFLQADILSSGNLGPFDAALLFEVFEHIPLEMADNFLAAVRQMLGPEGRLFMTVPHANRPVEYKHVQHFTVDSVSQYLKKDFEIVAVVPFERRGILRDTMEWILFNRFFLLNHRRLLNWLYRWQKARLFHCESEHQCQRIYLEAVVK